MKFPSFTDLYKNIKLYKLDSIKRMYKEYFHTIKKAKKQRYEEYFGTIKNNEKTTITNGL